MSKQRGSLVQFKIGGKYYPGYMGSRINARTLRNFYGDVRYSSFANRFRWTDYGLGQATPLAGWAAQHS